jgi:ABC-type transport system involved in multi-copper enzyme maturation permease subunit
VKAMALIAADSIRALLHKRFLVGLMIATIAITIAISTMFSGFRANMTESFQERIEAEQERQSKDMSDSEKRQMREALEGASFGFQTVFYFIASLGGSLVALFIFSTAVSSEIRSGTIRITLAKPVSRTQFLLGKYAGAVAVMAGYTVIMSAAMLAFVHTQQIALSPGLTFAPWLMFMKHLMMGALALMLSLLVHPFVAAVLAFFAGNGFYSPPNPLYYVLPSYSDFDMYSSVASGVLMSVGDVGWLSLYALDFVLVMLLLALWRFRKKELV